MLLLYDPDLERVREALKPSQAGSNPVMKSKGADKVEKQLIGDLKASYGICCHRIAPVAGGWLNQKWRIFTGEEELLVKQFSSQRYTKRKLDDIEMAMQRQVVLAQRGVPCPEILLHEKRAIRFLEDGTAYMVMRFCPGESVGPDAVTLRQMESLGSACGQMHRELSALPIASAKGYPLDSHGLIASLRQNFQEQAAAFSPSDPPGYQEAVLAQQAVLKKLEPDFFEGIPEGLAHEDFSPDNILFDQQGVTAILDFDRSCYSYLWHDIGRALLSLALWDGSLDTDRVAAFAAGYNRQMAGAALKRADVARALRLSWCIESSWWIQPEFFGRCSPKTARFREEILWVCAHWDELEELLVF